MTDAPHPEGPSLPFAPGKVIGGKYRVDRRIGAGAAGIVVAAEHLELQEPVALKILNPELKSNKEALARFAREARVMFTLKSEHVGRVFDVGKLDTGEPYIVMELLTGQTLGELLKEGRPQLADAWLLMRQISEAVGEAHAAGIVHRDLKPENIFVAKRGEKLHAKVIDFGVSRARFAQAESSITHVEALLGTPRYMAPEQFTSSQAAGPRSDVWSLGVIFYRMLGGAFPYAPKDVTDLVTLFKTTRPKPLRDIQPDVTVVMNAIVMRCLSVRPEDRYADARELAQVIAAVQLPGAPASPPVTPATAVAPPAPAAPPAPVVESVREPQPSFSDHVTTKRAMPDAHEALEEVEAEEEVEPEEEAEASYDDVRTVADRTVPMPLTEVAKDEADDDGARDPGEPSTRVRTAVLPTRIAPLGSGQALRPSSPAPATDPGSAARDVSPPRRGASWSEIEIAVVVGAFFTMLVIVVYMMVLVRRPRPPAPPSPGAPANTAVTAPTTQAR